VIGAVLILVVGWFFAGLAERGAYRAMSATHHIDETIRSFISKLVRYAILILVLVTVLSQFGVQTTSIIAALGAAGLAIGLALQGTLQNIAAGLMLLFLRPFRVGEYIDKHPAFAGAYTGRNPLAKPENYASAAVPLDLFEKVCASEMAAHNAREGRRGFGMEGRSFEKAFADHAPELGFRRAGPEQRRLFMLAAEGVTARKPDGRIELFENRFWCEALAERIGQKLIVRFDPQNLHEGVALYTLDNRFIADAARLDDIGFNSVDDAREAARLASQLERARKEAIQLSVRLDEAELKRLAPIDLPTDERPEPARVQRLVANGAPRSAGPGLDFAALDQALGRLAEISPSRGVIPFTPKDGR
jgi:hypothetical protein